ncbi:MAG: hypothetical protein LC623_06495, partial [Halobacteriales archaeon]|nr:hypothetical protein [Halobacteriales archaeon]
VLDARFEIAGGLPDLHPTAGQTSQVQVPVLNAGSGPAEAEVLLAVDGVLQSRRTVTLDPGEVRQVALPFKAGPSGARQDLEVLVRPVGSDAWLGDAALYDAGDVGSAKVEPVAGSSLPIPGLELLAALGACLAVAAARRRRA